MVLSLYLSISLSFSLSLLIFEYQHSFVIIFSLCDTSIIMVGRTHPPHPAGWGTTTTTRRIISLAKTYEKVVLENDGGGERDQRRKGSLDVEKRQWKVDERRRGSLHTAVYQDDDSSSDESEQGEVKMRRTLTRNNSFAQFINRAKDKQPLPNPQFRQSYFESRADQLAVVTEVQSVKRSPPPSTFLQDTSGRARPLIKPLTRPGPSRSAEPPSRSQQPDPLMRPRRRSASGGTMSSASSAVVHMVVSPTFYSPLTPTVRPASPSITETTAEAKRRLSTMSNHRLSSSGSLKRNNSTASKSNSLKRNDSVSKSNSLKRNESVSKSNSFKRSSTSGAANIVTNMKQDHDEDDDVFTPSGGGGPTVVTSGGGGLTRASSIRRSGSMLKRSGTKLKLGARKFASSFRKQTSQDQEEPKQPKFNFIGVNKFRAFEHVVRTVGVGLEH
eukprot:sb/3464728/